MEAQRRAGAGCSRRAAACPAAATGCPQRRVPASRCVLTYRIRPKRSLHREAAAVTATAGREAAGGAGQRQRGAWQPGRLLTAAAAGRGSARLEGSSRVRGGQLPQRMPTGGSADSLAAGWGGTRSASNPSSRAQAACTALGCVQHKTGNARHSPGGGQPRVQSGSVGLTFEHNSYVQIIKSGLRCPDAKAHVAPLKGCTP